MWSIFCIIVFYFCFQNTDLKITDIYFILLRLTLIFLLFSFWYFMF